MNDKEFFDKYVMKNPLSFKNNIIAHCRTLDKYDVYEWVANDELKIINLQKENQKLKEQLKQKEDIINKAIEFIKKHNETIGKLYFKCSNIYLLSEIKEDLLQILDNKGE